MSTNTGAEFNDSVTYTQHGRTQTIPCNKDDVGTYNAERYS